MEEFHLFSTCTSVYLRSGACTTYLRWLHLPSISWIWSCPMSWCILLQQDEIARRLCSSSKTDNALWTDDLLVEAFALRSQILTILHHTGKTEGEGNIPKVTETGVWLIKSFIDSTVTNWIGVQILNNNVLFAVRDECWWSQWCIGLCINNTVDAYVIERTEVFQSGIWLKIVWHVLYVNDIPNYLTDAEQFEYICLTCSCSNIRKFSVTSLSLP